MKKGVYKFWGGGESQENTCARVCFFNKVTGIQLATLLRQRLRQRYFHVNFAEILRTPFIQNTSGPLFLNRMLLTTKTSLQLYLKRDSDTGVFL